MVALSDLTDDEKALVGRLELQRHEMLGWLLIPDLYYRGEQKMQDLGISTPPSLNGLRTVVGWPRIAVEAIEERLDIEGFLFPGAADPDSDLQQIWQENNLDEESQLAHLDALVFGHCYVVTGVREDGSPLITVESPYNVSVDWDPRTRQVTAALQVYCQDPYALLRDRYTNLPQNAVLITPTAYVHLERGTSGWVVSRRDANPLGYVPVERMSNRTRVADRFGRSEITPEIRSIADAACRTLLGMEIAREFYSTPQRYVLGVDEENFQDANGNKISLWDTYLGKMWALPRDDNDELPTVGQFEAYDPGAYTKLLDAYAKIMVSQTGLPAQYLGITDLQPPSADAIRMAEQRLVKHAERKMRSFEGAWERSMRTALQFRQGAKFDVKRAAGLATVWRDAATPTLAAQADATAKWVAAGVLPPRSSVTLDRAGFSVAEQSRIQKDWTKEDSRQNLAALAARALQPADPQQQSLAPQFSSASGQ